MTSRELKEQVEAKMAKHTSEPAWSNDPVFEPTPREMKLKELAEEAKKIEPKVYNVTMNNTKAPRVIHDYDGRKIMIQPGEGKQGILLRPNVAEYLSKTGLTLEAA